MMRLVGGPVPDRLPQAFVDCLLDSALEPVLDAAVQRGGQAAKRKKNSGEAAEIARALLAVTVCDTGCAAAGDARGGGQLHLRRGRQRGGGGTSEGPLAAGGRRPWDDAALP